ncbi:MAG: hypothetical protein AAFZ38_06930 [Myxococcota bacterium]
MFGAELKVECILRSLTPNPPNPGANDTDVSPLDAIVREGARRLLQAALDNEVAEVIATRVKARL